MGGAEGLGRLYLSDSQREVIATMRRGLARPRAVVAVSGDAGLGKTTLVGAVLADLGEPTRIVTIPAADPLPALRDLQGATSPASGGILVVDDAHLLTADALTRLFAAWEDSQPHPVRLVLVMRSAFWSMLASPALAGIRDRIDTRAVLFPMSYTEAEAFVEHLFGLAGATAASVLSRERLHGLILRAGGVPQQLNVELDRALRGEAGRGAAPVAEPAPAPRPARRTGGIAASVLALAALGLAIWATTMPFTGPRPATDPVAEAPAANPPPPAPIAPPPTPTAAAHPALPPFSDPEVPPPDPVPWVAPDEAERAAPATAAAPIPDLAAAIDTPEPEPELAASADSAADPAAEPREALPPAVVALLLRRGAEMLELRDTSAARRLFERAAQAGSSTAAFALGQTYDPLHRSGTASVDAGQARRWYALAAERGDEEAARRLSALTPEKATQR